MATRYHSTAIFIVLISLLSICYGCGNGCPGESRIVGGSEAPRSKYGYIASLRNTHNTHRCAGVLIDKEWVATTATCARPLQRRRFKVYVGGHERDEVQGSHEAVSVSFAPGWRGDTRTGLDIALVKICPPSCEKPVELPEYFSTPERHLSLIALGWGRTSPGSDFSSVLNVAPNLNRLSPGECFRRHGGRVLSLLCAGGAGVGTCKGDQGGPLVTEDNVLVGITVFIGGASGDDCGELHKPSLFTNVGRHVPWISGVVG